MKVLRLENTTIIGENIVAFELRSELKAKPDGPWVLQVMFIGGGSIGWTFPDEKEATDCRDVLEGVCKRTDKSLFAVLLENEETIEPTPKTGVIIT